MPVRLIREGILTSERVDRLSWGGEVFYRRLLNVVDDYGRFDARPTLLRAHCYPLRLDAVTDGEILWWLQETVDAGLVSVYADGPRAFLQVHDFRQQTRAKSSKYPGPDGLVLITCVADAKQLLSTRSADAKHGVRPQITQVLDSEGMEENAKQMRSKRLARAEHLLTKTETETETETLKPSDRTIVAHIPGDPGSSVDQQSAMMAAYLRKEGVGITAMNPVLREWASLGVDQAFLTECLALARMRKPAPERVPARYLDAVIRSALQERDRPAEPPGIRERAQPRRRSETPAETMQRLIDEEAARGRETGRGTGGDVGTVRGESPVGGSGEAAGDGPPGLPGGEGQGRLAALPPGHSAH